MQTGAIITFLSKVGGAALTFTLLLGNDGWLLGKRLADRRIGCRIGCCCKATQEVEGTERESRGNSHQFIRI